MSQKHIILGVSLLLILSGVGYIFLGALPVEESATPAPTTAAPIGTQAPTQQEGAADTTSTNPDAANDIDLSKAFEDTLNTLVADIQKRTITYINQRQALSRAMAPNTIAAAKDLTQHFMTVQRLSAEQRTTIDDILLSFENTNADIESLLLKNVPSEEQRAELMQNWQNMRKTYVSPYFDFFEIEEQIITAQLNLMTLYTQQESITYNEAVDRITVPNPQAQAQANALRAVIHDFQREQVNMIR